MSGNYEHTLNLLKLLPRERILQIRPSWILSYLRGMNEGWSPIHDYNEAFEDEFVVQITCSPSGPSPELVNNIVLLKDTYGDPDIRYLNRMEVLSWVSVQVYQSVSEILLRVERYASPLEKLAAAAALD